MFPPPLVIHDEWTDVISKRPHIFRMCLLLYSIDLDVYILQNT